MLQLLAAAGPHPPWYPLRLRMLQLLAAAAAASPPLTTITLDLARAPSSTHLYDGH
eukprot:COSAG04_NODE_2048_length_4920_cov_4.440780_1_plen_55_part_10